NGPVNYDGLASLVVNGTTGVDTFTINSTAAGTATTVNGLDQDDQFNLTNLAAIGAAGLTLDGAPGSDTLTVQVAAGGATVTIDSLHLVQAPGGQVTYNNFAILNVNGTGGVDNFTINSIASGTATTVDAQGGLDTFSAISLTSIPSTASLTIHGGGQGE